MMGVKAYPLAWPAGWPRTDRREGGTFKTELPSALKFLRNQVSLMGGTGLVLSSNCSLGDERPKDPGVCAYFEWKKQHFAIPCDRWDKVASNVRAIGLTIEAMRGMERWGAKEMLTAMFTGFKALPERSGPSPWDILGIDADTATEALILEQWRKKATMAHPDKPTGSNEAFAQLSEAKDIALSTVRSR